MRLPRKRWTIRMTDNGETVETLVMRRFWSRERAEREAGSMTFMSRQMFGDAAHRVGHDVRYEAVPLVTEP